MHDLFNGPQRTEHATGAIPYDVFLSHNSSDKPAVRALATALRGRGVRVWFDEWELIAGESWQDALELAIEECQTAAVLIGKDGLGPWERQEMHACLFEHVNRQRRIIPVLLPGAPEEPQLPLFLRGFTWVDLREDFTEEGLDRLHWGVIGANPDSSQFDGNTPVATIRLSRAQPKHRVNRPLRLLTASLSLAVVCVLAYHAVFSSATTLQTIPFGILAVQMLQTPSSFPIQQPERPMPQCRRARIDAKVNHQKPSGAAWDVAGGAPDISMSAGGKSSTCRDTFRCSLTIDVKESSVVVNLFDLDIRLHDQIGSGRVNIPGTAQLGSAVVVSRCLDQTDQ